MVRGPRPHGSYLATPHESFRGSLRAPADPVFVLDEPRDSGSMLLEHTAPKATALGGQMVSPRK